MRGRQGCASLAVALLASAAILLDVPASAQPTPDPFGADAFATDLPEPLPPAPPSPQPDALATDQPGAATPAQPVPPTPTPGATTPAPTPTPTPTAPPADLTPPPSSQPVPARQALTQPSTPSLQGGFTVRLARAPKMLGDFFGNSFAPAEGRRFVGRAIHHVTSINDIHRIDESGPKVLYLGGPNGDIPDRSLPRTLIPRCPISSKASERTTSPASSSPSAPMTKSTFSTRQPTRSPISPAPGCSTSSRWSTSSCPPPAPPT